MHPSVQPELWEVAPGRLEDDDAPAVAFQWDGMGGFSREVQGQKLHLTPQQAGKDWPAALSPLQKQTESLA